MKGRTTAGTFLCELFFPKIKRRCSEMITVNGKEIQMKQSISVAAYLEYVGY